MLLVVIALVVAFVSFVYWKIKHEEHNNKVFEIYSQPGMLFYAKFVIFYLLLKLYELNKHKKKNVEDLDRLLPLSEHNKAFDAVSFQAVNPEGHYLYGGIERRHLAKINGFFYLVTPEFGLLRSPHIPKTNLDADTDMLHDMKSYNGGGIRFSPIKPMKLWKLSYNGKMLDQNENSMDVVVEADWNSNLPCFMFDSDMSRVAIARAAAAETWTEDFFKNIKKAHQSHYEQMGYLKGFFSINGKKYEIKMDASRNHSFGHKRDWLLMHRYIFHFIYLEDNTRICVGVLSHPCTTSHMEVGYVISPKKAINPIEKCDLLLYQHGENGTPGKNIAFRIWTRKKEYLIKAKTIYENDHFIGNDCEARIVFKCVDFEVNGMKGRGFAEWQYNNQKIL